ncbi:MAG: type VI secretion system tube protein Hcp [Actinomycetota bacterium]
MQTESVATSRWNVILVLAVVIAMATAWMVTTDRAGADAAPATAVANQGNAMSDLLALQMDVVASGDIFAKYDGVDGESNDKNHPQWIEVLGVEWGAHSPEAGVGADSRRRGSAVADDFVLTFVYEKAVPKLADKLFKGAVIPQLKVEFTRDFGLGSVTYLKYELTNVKVTDYAIVGETGKGQPHVAFANTFEKVKVTYTEYDSEGHNLGNVEYEYSVE